MAFRPTLLLLLLLPAAPAAAPAQKLTPIETLTTLPAGLTLPVRIGHSVRAGSLKPGAPITASTTQRIPLANHTFLPHGAKVTGAILTSQAAEKDKTEPAVLTIRFTSLTYRHQTIPIRTSALAIANFTEVSDTAAPANGSTDRGNPSPASWNTLQVGGDEVSRSGWIGEVVDSTMHRVGSADYFGVYADPPPNATGPASIPRAMGVFSTSAHGLYGFNPGAALTSTSEGQFTITSPGTLTLRNGDNLLLQLLPTP
ncbi:MAG: hypothetical protein M3Y50_02100 [Acidobacteriota bacterium]|nr:hypothetical protein [Acidobacteriota bacterium]